MAEEGVRDFQVAKRKAGERLNTGTGVLPSNREIADALDDYLATFQAGRLRHNRDLHFRLAREAMAELAGFEPRAVGGLARGTVTDFSVVELHLFADSFEDVNLFLLERGIRCDIGDRRLRYGGDRVRNQPLCRFELEGVGMELVVFPVNGLREAPLSPVDGQPMRRLSVTELDALGRELGI
jgi:hypothetical protein